MYNPVKSQCQERTVEKIKQAYLIVLVFCLLSLITQVMDELELHPKEIKVKLTVQYTHTCPNVVCSMSVTVVYRSSDGDE